MKIRVIDYGYEKLPLRAHSNDAGADVHACLHNDKCLRVQSGDTVKVPLGFGLVLPDGYAAYIFPRSGLSSQGIVCEIPPIDSGYRGEIFAIVHNGSNVDYKINNGFRIGQLVVMPVVIAEFCTEKDEERGSAAFGSTGL